MFKAPTYPPNGVILAIRNVMRNKISKTTRDDSDGDGVVYISAENSNMSVTIAIFPNGWFTGTKSVRGELVDEFERECVNYAIDKIKLWASFRGPKLEVIK